MTQEHQEEGRGWSAARKGVTLISINRNSHSCGSIAATVTSPSGGVDADLRMNASAYLKLQKVLGNSG